MMLRTTFAGAAAGIALIAGAQAATAEAHIERLTVAYFLEWPMPFQFSKENGVYDERLGIPVDWVAFDTGTAMSAAMASGDVQIAVSQGVPPFVVATSQGQDLQAIDVAVSYSDNDNCVVRSDLEIDKTNAGDLAGMTAAVPLGTAAHYGFLRQMDHFGVDVSTMQVVDMAPAEGAVAIGQGDVDIACGYGAGLTRMTEFGNVLLTGAEKEEIGIPVFDVTSAPADFVAENADLVAQFLAVTAEANAMWNEGSMQEEMIGVIAQDAGMTQDATRDFMATFTFPSIEQQLSETWFGGNTEEFMKGVAGVFVEAGSIPSALDSYAQAVNVGPLETAQSMSQ